MVTSLSIVARLLLAVLVVLPLLLALPALWPMDWGQWSQWLEPAGQSALLVIVTTVLLLVLALSVALKTTKQNDNPSARVNGLSVLLAMPHVAFTVGLLLLFSPTGLWVRALDFFINAISHFFESNFLQSNALEEWLAIDPQDWALPEKSLATLLLVLVLKELPFLLLMIHTQCQSLPIKQWLIQSQSLGWSRTKSWWLVVVPAVLPRLMLPLAAVSIYTLSVVDVALIAGPNAPGVLATQVFEQFYQWQASEQASAGALLLLLIALAVVVFNDLLQRLYLRCAHYWRQAGHKYPTTVVGQWLNRWFTRWLSQFYNLLSSSVMPVLVVISGVVLVLLVVQSIAGAWFYPQLLPSNWNLNRWLQEWPYIAPLLWHSAWLAALSALLSTLAAMVVLEVQRRQQQRRIKVLPLLLLMVPQVVLVMGWQRVFGQGSEGLVVTLAHWVFGFPYAYLVLHASWVNYPQHWLNQAQSLGYSPCQSVVKVMLPMLKGPIAITFAVAFSVSIAQYVPTLWLAGGTLPTLTTEAVAISSGGDWRLTAVYVLWQMLLPCMLFALMIRQSSHANHS